MTFPFDISPVQIADALVLPRGISPAFLGISVGIVAGVLVFGLVFLTFGRRRIASAAGGATIETAEPASAIALAGGPRQLASWPGVIRNAPVPVPWGPGPADETRDSQIVIVEPSAPAVLVSRVVMVGEPAESAETWKDDAATIVSETMFDEVTRGHEARP